MFSGGLFFGAPRCGSDVVGGMKDYTFLGDLSLLFCGAGELMSFHMEIMRNCSNGVLLETLVLWRFG